MVIQLYAKVHDVIPTEQKEVKAWEDATAYSDPDEVGKWKMEQWLDDFKQNGIKYQVRMHPSGHVADGNFRYWGARELGWDYIPIDVMFYTGIRRVGDILTIRGDLLADKRFGTGSLYDKRPIDVGHTTFAEEDGRCEYEKLGRGNHPHVYHNRLRFFQDTHRKETGVRFR